MLGLRGLRGHLLRAAVDRDDAGLPAAVDLLLRYRRARGRACIRLGEVAILANNSQTRSSDHGSKAHRSGVDSAKVDGTSIGSTSMGVETAKVETAKVGSTSIGRRFSKNCRHIASW